MANFIIAYAICVSVLMIWSTSPHERARSKSGQRTPKGGINYVVIPRFLLREWATCYPNLVIFDLRTYGERNARQEDTPGSLTISKGDLPNLVKWLPPESTVVFSCGELIERFDAQVEGTLLQLGIESIFFVGRSVDSPLTVNWYQKDARSRVVRQDFGA